MLHHDHVSGPEAFTSFGELLYYLRRRAHLKQRDLAIATGYSEAQISRLEQNRRLPDQTTLAALFIPALGLDHDPAWATRLLALAAAARAEKSAPEATRSTRDTTFEGIPVQALHEVPRPRALARLQTLCALERRVALCGLAGVGKTTLAATLARAYTSGPVFWLTLAARVNTSAEAIIHQMAEFLYAHGQKQVSPLIQHGERNEPPLPLDRQLALIGAGLSALVASSTPPLICIDNVYLVQYEEQPVQVLRYLVAATPATLLMISREQLPFPEVTQMLLHGLEPHEGRALLDALIGDPPLSVGLATRLLQKTGGNPMLLRLAAGHMLDEHTNRAEFVARLEQQPQIAAYLVDTVQRRLSPSAWRLLALAALMRRPVDLYDSVLARLCVEHNLDITEDAIAELQQHLLIARPAEAEPPPLIRESIASSLLADPSVRRVLHLVAAEWAELTYGETLLAAYHFNRASELEQAAEALTGQAEALAERGQALAAAHLVDELLAQAKRAGRSADDQIGRLLTLRGDLLVNTLSVADGESSYRAALAHTHHPVVRARIISRLAFSLVQRGHAEEALRRCQEARAQLEEADTLLLTELAITEGWAYRIQSEYDALLHSAEQGLALADALAQVLPQMADRSRALIRANIGYFHYTRRALHQAAVEVDMATSAAEQAGQPRLARRYRGSAAHIRLAQGDLSGALRMLQELLHLARDAGDSLSVEYLLSLTMTALYLRGNVDEASATFDGAWALRQTLGLFAGVPIAEAFYPTVLIGLGRLDEARAMLDTLLARIKPTGEGREFGYNQTRRAVLHLLDGEVVLAEQHLREVLALPAAQHDSKLRTDAETYLALVGIARGDSAAENYLVADSPPSAGPWALHERTAARALFSHARGDHECVAQELNTLRREARTTGHGIFLRIAEQIAAATTTVPMDVPRLLFVVQ